MRVDYDVTIRQEKQVIDRFRNQYEQGNEIIRVF